MPKPMPMRHWSCRNTNSETPDVLPKLKLIYLRQKAQVQHLQDVCRFGPLPADLQSRAGNCDVRNKVYELMAKINARRSCCLFERCIHKVTSVALNKYVSKQM